MNTTDLDQIEDIQGLIDGQILRGSPENYRSSVEYKGLSYRRDRNMASITYDVKRARAFFDPNLGPSGGYRCPVGTRYGGRITDRYGRNCGWGVARRLANAISDTGERLEGALNRRDSRRNTRGGKKPVRRIGTPAARVSRQGRNAGRAATPANQRDRRITPRTRRGEGAPERMDRTADEVLEGTFLEGVRTRRAARRTDRAGRQANKPRTQRQRRGEGVPERMDRTAREVLSGTYLANRRNRRAGTRSRREQAQIQRTKPSGGNTRPSGPTRPAGEVARPVRRSGPRVDVGEEGSDRRKRAKELLETEKSTINTFWSTRLRGKAATHQNILAYVAEREQREGISPAYRNTLKARAKDHKILNGPYSDRKVDDLSPAVRKRLKAGLDRTPDREKPKKPEAVETPETPEVPKKPKVPETPEVPREEGPRRSPRRSVSSDELSDDLEENRRINREIEREIEGLRRRQSANLERIRNSFSEAELESSVEALRYNSDAATRLAEDVTIPVRQRFKAQRVASVYSAAAKEYQEVLDQRVARRLAAAEAANAPEAPSGPATPRPPEGGRRVETFGLSKERLAELDAVIESDNQMYANQLSEIRRLERNGENPSALIARRYDEALNTLEVVKMVSGDAIDRYLAQQGTADVRAFLTELEALREGRTVPAPVSPSPGTPGNDPDLLIPDPVDRARLRVKFEQKAAKILAKRKETIGDYMTKRYGSGAAPWKDTDKNFPIDELIRLFRIAEGNGPDSEEARKLAGWAQSIYNIPEIIGSDGGKYRISTRSQIESFWTGIKGIDVTGNIQFYDEDSQRWMQVGSVQRSLKLYRELADGTTDADFEPFVKNDLLKIWDSFPEHKNLGLASIYNPHAFTWLKASGFKRADVGAAWDGQFVWGKLGFRTNELASKNIAQRLEEEIKIIRSGGTSNVINKRDADIIAALIDEAKRRDYDIRAPQHSEYLMAMSNRNDETVKQWFTDNVPFGNGSFFFDEVPDDPRS